MFDVSKRVALGAALGVPLVGAVLPAASAAAAVEPPAPDAPRNHCVTSELTPQQLASGQRSSLSCFATFSEALASRGVRVGADVQPAGLSVDVILSVTSLAAIHYEGSGASGASLQVYGDCNGGGISLDPSWDNKISSTRHGACSTVKHFDTTAYSGAQENTAGGYGAVFTLTTLNDQVGSVKYFA